MIAHPDYWKVKAAFLLAQKARLEAELLVMRSEAQLGFVMKMAGLDPQQQYELNDTDESVTPRDTTPVSAPVAGS
jgi:hypothetical protein